MSDQPSMEIIIGRQAPPRPVRNPALLHRRNEDFQRALQADEAVHGPVEVPGLQSGGAAQSPAMPQEQAAGAGGNPFATMDTSQLLALADSLLKDTSGKRPDTSQSPEYTGPDTSQAPMPSPMMGDDPSQMAALQEVLGKANKARSMRGAYAPAQNAEPARVASESAAMGRSDPMGGFAMQVAMSNDRQASEEMTRNRMMRAQMDDMEDERKRDRRRRMAALLYGMG